MNYQQACRYLEKHGQIQLLRFYSELDPKEQKKLLKQISYLDLEKPQYQGLDALQAERGVFSPLGALTMDKIEEKREEYKAIGIEAIRNGKVGAVLLAGGQGSRLGFDHPKGMFNIGVNRTLYIFECLFQNLIQVANEANAYVPLFIMTNESNDEETRAFLKEHNYFGYSEANVHFFQQEMEAAVDENGKVLLSEKGRIALSPNGNGGWFSSMQRAGYLDMLSESGVEWLNVFAVDNVLQQIADPVFIGATLASGSDSGAKVVSKNAPEERVGVLCLEDGKPSIAEYYEITEDMRNLRDENGDLLYRFGVILNYLFRVDELMQTLSTDFPLHIAHKKIPYVDALGQKITPTENNGYKFETLVLDMVHMQNSCLAFEVDREKEFAPVKNATGVDSIETARILLEKNGIEL